MPNIKTKKHIAREKREDIVINEEWAIYVPDTPEVPQSLITELFSQTSGTP